MTITRVTVKNRPGEQTIHVAPDARILAVLPGPGVASLATATLAVDQNPAKISPMTITLVDPEAEEPAPVGRLVGTTSDPALLVFVREQESGSARWRRQAQERIMSHVLNAARLRSTGVFLTEDGTLSRPCFSERDAIAGHFDDQARFEAEGLLARLTTVTG